MQFQINQCNIYEAVFVCVVCLFFSLCVFEREKKKEGESTIKSSLKVHLHSVVQLLKS